MSSTASPSPRLPRYCQFRSSPRIRAFGRLGGSWRSRLGGRSGGGKQMRRRRDDFSREVGALLESGRPIVAISAAARARAIARARSSVAALSLAPEVVLRPRTSSHSNWLAAAAGVAFVAGIAGGAAAYEHGLHARPARTDSLPPAPAPRNPVVPSEVIHLPMEPVPVDSPPPSRAILAREELWLL